MKKLVLMKYLDKKGIPRYRSMPKIDMPDNEVDNRVNLMEVEADEELLDKYTIHPVLYEWSKKIIG